MSEDEWVFISYCSVSGCAALGPITRGFCEKHYSRWKKHRDVNVVLDSGKKILEGFCLVNACGGTLFAKGYCSKHYTRWRKHGDPVVTVEYNRISNLGSLAIHTERGQDSPSWQGDNIGYAAAHYRVKALHGSAKNWPCASQCDNQADQWAYCHDGEIELFYWAETYNEEEVEVAYSPNPEDYVPLCKSCHVKFDKSFA